MSLLSRIRNLFRPAPDRSNVDLVESLEAEMAFRQDKLRRETAVDEAMTRAHAAAVEDNRAYQKRNPTMPEPPTTPFSRALRRVK